MPKSTSEGNFVCFLKIFSFEPAKSNVSDMRPPQRSLQCEAADLKTLAGAADMLETDDFSNFEIRNY